MLNDSEGNAYYYNTKTGATQWEVPSTGTVTIPGLKALFESNYNSTPAAMQPRRSMHNKDDTGIV